MRPETGSGLGRNSGAGLVPTSQTPCVGGLACPRRGAVTPRQPAQASLLASWPPLVTLQESAHLPWRLWFGDASITAQLDWGTGAGPGAQRHRAQAPAPPGTQRGSLGARLSLRAFLSSSERWEGYALGRGVSVLASPRGFSLLLAPADPPAGKPTGQTHSPVQLSSEAPPLSPARLSQLNTTHLDRAPTVHVPDLGWGDPGGQQ